MTNEDDRELSGSDAREAIADVHQDFLRFLTRRLGNEDEAADVLHDFYVKVLTRIGEVRENEKLRAWMRRVLETSLIDYYRVQGKKRESEKKHHYLESASLDDDVKDDPDFIVCMCIHRLLPTLKPEYADILWHAELAGQSRESIAAAYGISEGNLRVRLHRAREALKRRLEEACRSCPVHGYLNCDCDSGPGQSHYGGASG